MASRRVPPPQSPALALNRTIRNRRTGLDLDLDWSGSLDLDPTAEIHPYPFALAILLKSPSSFLESTRGPAVFKTNYRWAKNLAQTTLSYLEIEPTVQPLTFCELDPRTKV